MHQWKRSYLGLFEVFWKSFVFLWNLESKFTSVTHDDNWNLAIDWFQLLKSCQNENGCLTHTRFGLAENVHVQNLEIIHKKWIRSEIVSNGEYQTSFEIIGRTIISITVSVYHSLVHKKVMNPRYLHTILFINMSNFDKIKMVWPSYVSTYLTLSWVIIFEPD